MLIKAAGYVITPVGPGWLLWPQKPTAVSQTRQLLRHVRDVEPEIEEGDQLVRVLDRLAVNVVLDVGANVGQYALRLRSAGYRGHILSFEPLLENFEKLRAQAAGDPAWKVYRLALGREAGELPIQVTGNTVFTSFLPPNQASRGLFGKFAEVTRIETVPVQSLDGILDGLLQGIDQPRLFLKMDTQGYDLAVCQGAQLTLKQARGVQSELSVLPLYEGMPAWLDVIEYYQKAGFVPAGLFPLNHHPDTLQVIEFDGIFIRASVQGGG